MTTHAQRRPTQLGFTLAEVAMAVAITAFVLVGLLGVAAQGLRMGRLAVDDTFVSTIAQDVFSDVRRQTHSGIMAMNNQQFLFDREGFLTPPGQPFYKCKVKVTQPSPFISDVELELVWPNVNGFASAPFTNRYFTKVANTSPHP
jgi:uncharacterized protein (TIGR02598 family)